MSENIARNMQSNQGTINCTTQLHLFGHFNKLKGPHLLPVAGSNVLCITRSSKNTVQKLLMISENIARNMQNNQGTINCTTQLHLAGHFNSLDAELNPICHLLALLGAHHILHVSQTRVNKLYLDARNHEYQVEIFLKLSALLRLNTNY